MKLEKFGSFAEVTSEFDDGMGCIELLGAEVVVDRRYRNLCIGVESRDCRGTVSISIDADDAQRFAGAILAAARRIKEIESRTQEGR